MSEQDGIASIVSARRADGDGDSTYFESKLWSRLGSAQDTESYARNWLDIQCRMFEGVIRATLVARASESGNFAPIALWPEGVSGSPELAKAIEHALTERRVTVQGLNSKPDPQGHVFIAHPIIVDDQLYGAVALEVESRSKAALASIVERLGWGAGWLDALARRRTFTSRARLVTVLQLIATSIHYERFQAAATAVASELATTLSCERVSIGFRNRQHISVRALSNSSSFGEKTNLIRALGAAMDEAADQLATVVYPQQKGGPFQVTRAHAELVSHHGVGSICTVPLTAAGEVLGALTLERPVGEEFDARTIELCEHAAVLLGPVLDVKRKEDRWLLQKAMDSMETHLRHLIGPRHVALKLSTGLLVAAILFLSIAEGDYQVNADAVLEGSVQRAVAVAMPGYIAEAGPRAGDVVQEGDLLAVIDDRDLRLERLNWVSQRAQRQREYSAALAANERAQVGILSAQLEQADAQLALIDEQLTRTRIVAPFDGLIVTGDLSQSLGAPVERGDILFQLAPLDSYRVIMKVDERDITNVDIGQGGNLALSSMPDQPLPLTVEKITPVSVVEEGRNYFRVEARLDGDIERLSPGMEGVGRIQVDQRKLIWIWTHKLVHWVKMWIWSWWP